MKQAISFLAGTTFATAIVIFAGGRSSAMIALGFILTVSIASGLLWLTGVNRLIELLSKFRSAPQQTAATPRKRGPAPTSQSDKWEQVLKGERQPTKRQERQAAREAAEFKANQEADEFFVEQGVEAPKASVN